LTEELKEEKIAVFPVETPLTPMLKKFKNPEPQALRKGREQGVSAIRPEKISVASVRENNHRTLLSTLDWDFKNAKTENGINSIHPYPAKFISQIPRKLIELYKPQASTVVLDPFCGSGTTLVEAIGAGFDAVGIDVNPLACLISRVKTTPLPQGFREIGNQIIEKTRVCLANRDFKIPPIPNLDHWFDVDVQNALAALIQEISSVESTPLKEVLQVALSSIIVKVSKQESDTRYAAIEKNVTTEDVIQAFDHAVSRTYQKILSFWNTLDRCFGKKMGQATVLNRDILSVKAEDLPFRVGLVVTSPPYPNAYEYWLYHKYRMYWLGMAPKIVLKHEIGARPHYFTSRPQTERDFHGQMATVFGLLSCIMVPNSKACFLVGRSKIHGKLIDNSTLLQHAAQSNGFVLEASTDRTILSNRKSFNPKHGNITKEAIMVFSLRENREH